MIVKLLNFYAEDDSDEEGPMKVGETATEERPEEEGRGALVDPGSGRVPPPGGAHG